MSLNKRIIGIRLKLSGRAQHVVPATEEGAVTKDSACPKTLLWNLPCLRPCIKNFLGQVLYGFLKVCWICFLGNIYLIAFTHIVELVIYYALARKFLAYLLIFLCF